MAVTADMRQHIREYGALRRKQLLSELAYWDAQLISVGELKQPTKVQSRMAYRWRDALQEIADGQPDARRLAQKALRNAG